MVRNHAIDATVAVCALSSLASAMALLMARTAICDRRACHAPPGHSPHSTVEARVRPVDFRVFYLFPPSAGGAGMSVWPLGWPASNVQVCTLPSSPTNGALQAKASSWVGPSSMVPRCPVSWPS